MTDSVLIGGADGKLIGQPWAMSNRHGLVAGATGTGKTVTLQVLAEGFSRAGVPVFAVDVKGDLSGIAQPGKPHKEIDRRLSIISIPDYAARGCPTMFWDIYGEQGHPVRTTISEVGPLILGNLLELNDTQSGILYALNARADTDSDGTADVDEICDALQTTAVRDPSDWLAFDNAFRTGGSFSGHTITVGTVLAVNVNRRGPSETGHSNIRVAGAYTGISDAKPATLGST